MTITFGVISASSHDLGATGTWLVACGCRREGEAQMTFASYLEASDWLRTYQGAPFPLDGCTDEFCLTNGPMLFAEMTPVATTAPDFSLSEDEARDMLIVLGFADLSTGEMVGDLYGEAQAQDFLGRVLIGQALNPALVEISAPKESGESAFAHVALVHPKGWVQEQLKRLRNLAQYAVDHDMVVTWR